MKKSKLKILIMLTICIDHLVCFKWARRKEDSIVKFKHQIDEIVEIENVHGCLAKCQSVVDCESISWYQGNTTCLLFDMNVINDKRDRFSKWMPLGNWTTYSKALYPVVRKMKHNSELLEMSFDEAVQTCLDQYSTIATPDDLLEARALGMDNCYCGWLSNGQNGLVTLTVDSCPDYGFSTDVIYCNAKTAVAWCKLW